MVRPQGQLPGQEEDRITSSRVQAYVQLSISPSSLHLSGSVGMLASICPQEADPLYFRGEQEYYRTGKDTYWPEEGHVLTFLSREMVSISRRRGMGMFSKQNSY